MAGGKPKARKSDSIKRNRAPHCGTSSQKSQNEVPDSTPDFQPLPCKSGKPRKTRKCALCTVDDTCCFHVVRLGPKTSVHEKHVSVKSTVTSCDVTNCATTLQGFNKHASSRREAVSDSRGTEKISKNLRLLTWVGHSTRSIHHTRIQ